MRILKTKKNVSTLSAVVALSAFAFISPTVAYSSTSTTSILYYGDEDGALTIDDSSSFSSDEFYTFISNSIVSENGTAKGAAVFLDIDDSIDLIDAAFISNYTSGANSAGGALIVESGTIDELNATFSNNYAMSESGTAFGGAIANYGTMSAVEGDISGNYAKSTSGIALGGAVYAAAGSSTLFRASKNTDYSYTGNYVEVGGERLDSAGGFLYLDGDASVTFNTRSKSTITIGLEDNAGFDSIASSDSTSSIYKTGTGDLIVNSSMEYYTGSLTVNAGTMTVNNTLSASSIYLRNDASLTVDTLNVYLNAATSTTSSAVYINASEESTFVLNSLNIYLDADFVNAFTGVEILIVDDSSLISGAALSVYYEDGSRSSGEIDSSLYTYVNGVFTYVGAVPVPEPSTYAMIFGVVALGFAYYRRRK